MLIGFSSAMREQQTELKRFLRANLYQHYRVNRMTAKAHRIIKELFAVFLADIRLMPDEFQVRESQDMGGQDASPKDKARAVADYIAGMTDRYAIKEHQRLFTIADREL